MTVKKVTIAGESGDISIIVTALFLKKGTM
jgi:hypothetical protein